MKLLLEILNGKAMTRGCGIAMVCALVCGVVPNVFAANVVARPTASSTASRAQRTTQAAARVPTMTTQSSATTEPTIVISDPEPTVITEPEILDEPEIVVENKSSKFSSLIKSTSGDRESSSYLAEQIRAARAARDADDALAAATLNGSGSGANLCDSALRSCMTERCGIDFSKCASDTDTSFNDKMDTCRRTTNCTGHEYQLFAPEINADRMANIKIAEYNAITDCGRRYNECIIDACGKEFSDCLGKNAGDAAITRCGDIAKSCTEHDSGLAMRAMGVFGELRTAEERRVATAEQDLYNLRDQIRAVCTRLGAMFDERSLNCVYTVNFRADDTATLFASKKAHAGSTFDCTPDWFGIDITTFRENAYRTTREQSAASGALLGAGLGVTAGAISSGAIVRAIERSTTKNDYDQAECINKGGKWNAFFNTCSVANVEHGDDSTATTAKPTKQENENAKKEEAKKKGITEAADANEVKPQDAEEDSIGGNGGDDGPKSKEAESDFNPKTFETPKAKLDDSWRDPNLFPNASATATTADTGDSKKKVTTPTAGK